MSRTDIGTATWDLACSPGFELGLEGGNNRFVDGDSIGCIIVFSEFDGIITVPCVEVNNSRFCGSFKDIYRYSVHNTTFKFNFFHC